MTLSPPDELLPPELEEPEDELVPEEEPDEELVPEDEPDEELVPEEEPEDVLPPELELEDEPLQSPSFFQGPYSPASAGLSPWVHHLAE